MSEFPNESISENLSEFCENVGQIGRKWVARNVGDSADFFDLRVGVVLRLLRSSVFEACARVLLKEVGRFEKSTFVIEYS